MIGSHLASRYHILAELGRGGRGVVYRAHDPMLKRDVAVKIVPPSLADEEAEQRFLREAQLVAQMDAPGIVPVYDFGRHEGTLFYVMPILHGTTLRELYKAGTLSLGEMLEVAAQVAEALDYSHDRGVVHRDVKPENIMASRLEHDRWRVRVMDFGLAQDTHESRLTRTGQLPGTLAYLSPEQVLGAEVDGRCDLYALAALLHEGLAGEPPFAGQLYSVLFRIVHEAPPPLPPGRSPSSALEALILAGLAKEPGKRPGRGRDMAAALRAIIGELGQEQRELRLLQSAEADPGQTTHPLIGRAAVFDAIAQRLEKARGGEAQFVLIGGESGVGKSRLLQAVEKLARDRQFLVLRGRFAGAGEGLPYHGLCEPIQDYFRSRRAPVLVSGAGRTSQVDASLVESWLDVAAPLLRQFPPLSEIPELLAAAERAPSLPPMARATELYETLARAYTRFAAGRPLLLSLENLHVDPPSVEALQYVVRRLGVTPTVVVATYRSEEVDRQHAVNRMIRDFADDPRFVAFRLGAFDADELRLFLASLVDGAPMRSDLVDKLHAITEGNARFARELVSAWLVSGDLRRDASGLLGLGVADHLPALPATVQEAVEARLAHLPTLVRSLLEMAAVLGRSFDERMLAALAADGDLTGLDLDDTLDDLVEQGILQDETRGRGDRLRFSHGVVRDVLYHDLPRRRRRRLHRRVAELLEHRHGEKLAPHYPQLLHHYAAAEAAPEAVLYAVALAEHALAAFSPQDALDAVSRGLELVDETIQLDLQGRLHELAARAHRGAGDVARALQRAEQAYDLYVQAGDSEAAGRAGWMAADAAWQGRRVEIAARFVEKALAELRPRGETHWRGHALALGSMVAAVRGERELAAAYHRELEAVRASPGAEVALVAGGELVAAMALPVAFVDPGNLVTDEQSEIAALIYETLVVNDGEGRLIPWLAEDWRELDGGRLFEVDLRRDATFSNGRPVDAAAVKASFQRSALRSRGSLAPGFFRVIAGMDAFLAGETIEVAGIEIRETWGLSFHLVDPLPIFPVLLSDNRTSVAALGFDADGHEQLQGSGPFRLISCRDLRVRLQRVDDYWRGRPARIERLDFRTGLEPAAIAAGLQDGTIDIGRDLLPQDLEGLLARPSFRVGLVETTRRNTHFALFNLNGPYGHLRELRRVLCGVVHRHDLVWRTLGRFGHPAVSLIPPGMLGHEAGRRPWRLDLEDARAKLAELGLPAERTLRAVVHPVFLGKYRPLLDALFGVWAQLGLTVEIVNRDMAEFYAAYHDSEGIDLLFGRWNTDYDDPDNFTYNILHSQAGIYQRYFGLPEADLLLERARQTRDSAGRAELYHRFESLLSDQGALLPLCHDVDYRLAAPGIGGLVLRSTYPYLNYAEIGRRQHAAGEARAVKTEGRAELHVPCSYSLRDVDPLNNNYIGRVDVIAAIFETLLRLDEGGRPVPHLARTVELSDDGKSLRLRLRSGLTYHNGRRLTARDVIYSLERLARADDPSVRAHAEPIRGFRAFAAGEVDRLEGLHLPGPDEVLIELEEPVFAYPAVLTHPATAIVPEGADRFDRRWRDGTVGTGPFRVVQLIPEQLLEIERHPGYWRLGLPKTERIVFHLGLAPERIEQLFRQGRVALANDLRPEQIEAINADRNFPHRFHQYPRLSTHFLLFNSAAGIFADKALRRRALQALDLESLIALQAGPLAVPARGLIPPALLGLEPRALGPTDRGREQSDTATELRVAKHGVFAREFAGLWDQIDRRLAKAGFHADVEEIADDYNERWQMKPPDLVAFRWVADYPDPDAFLLVIRLFSELGMVAPGIGQEIERIGKLARRVSDARIRRANYLEIEALLEQESLLVPLLHEQAYRFYAPQLHGLRLNLGLPEIRYEELYLGGEA